MRLVEWEDESGYKHLALVRDDDAREMFPYGISLDPPDIELLDWREIKKNLHNLLVELRLSDWRDAQKNKASITSAILGSVRRPLSELYKVKYLEREAK